VFGFYWAVISQTNKQTNKQKTNKQTNKQTKKQTKNNKQTKNKQTNKKQTNEQTKKAEFRKVRRIEKKTVETSSEKKVFFTPISSILGQVIDYSDLKLSNFTQFS